ncbi:alpha-ketoglutarate-dependent dioxygenase AlkB [Sagittula marina]
MKSLATGFKRASFPDMTELKIKGFRIFPGALDRAAQLAVVDDVREVLRAAPLVRPRTRRGPMSVRMSAAGDFGWISDTRGYRYEKHHPDGQAWPPIPASILALWDRFADCERAPECCLINWYAEDARMGLHQDKDEQDYDCPVLSVSLGDDALFRMGGEDRKDSTKSHWLTSGDVVLLTGTSRRAFHGVDRVRPGSSTLFSEGGRLNLTLRVVT